MGHLWTLYACTFPDWAHAIGQHPKYTPPLPTGLQDGFTGEDVGALGLWLRDEGAKQQATAEEAAREAQNRDARLAAAKASLRGRPAVRGEMRIYYGMAGTTANRFSERFIQLRVRQRLCHTIRERLRQEGDWRSLPRGQGDIGILQHVGV